ncbi:hypothetical protein EI94DRAFT_1754490 [Lactarius quietus]|nr:hypothetical protein EI94DRAFT_1754490 [Lactarius quietus]
MSPQPSQPPARSTGSAIVIERTSTNPRGKTARTVITPIGKRPVKVATKAGTTTRKTIPQRRQGHPNRTWTRRARPPLVPTSVR